MIEKILLENVLRTQEKYSEKILAQDMSSPTFFLEQIVSLIDEIYEFIEVSKNLTTEYYETISKYKMDLVKDPVVEELVDMYCFIGNLIHHYEKSNGEKFIIFNYDLYSRNALDIMKWLPSFNLDIRTLIRHTGTWDTWKRNNKRNTDWEIIPDIINSMLHKLYQIREELVRCSNGKYTTEVFYNKYKDKVWANVIKQNKAKALLEDKIFNLSYSNKHRNSFFE